MTPTQDRVPIDQLNQDRTIEYVRDSTGHLLSSFREKLDLLRGNAEVSQRVLRMGYSAQTCFE
ncbi:MAG: hypothetical protein ACREBS_00330, partial [Nitrososphaerales archaeon]